MKHPAGKHGRQYLTAAAVLLYGIAHAQSTGITIDAGRVLNKVPAKLYGSCIEDVNHEIYGGLYDQRLYGESFEEPPVATDFTGWTTFGGDWQPANNAVLVSAGPGYKIVRTTPVMYNGSIEADIRIDSGYNTGLLVRVQRPHTGADNFTGYEISLNPAEQTVILGKHDNNWQPLTTAKVTIKFKEWMHIKVVMQNAALKVYVNHSTTPAIDFTDENAPLTAGQVALRTYNATAAFKQVLIRTGNHIIKNEFKGAASLPVSGMWMPVNTGSKGSFALDRTSAFNGSQSQVLQRSSGNGITGVANQGLNRWGIAVKTGRQFQGSIYLRAQHLLGPVTLALQSANGQKTYAVHTIANIPESWSRYAFSLTSGATDPKARFVVYIAGPGKLWIDQATLMAAAKDQFKGLPLRADIAVKMQQEGLNFLRYGGTMVNAPEYRWKKMIGPREKRPPYKGHWYPCSTNGFGIEDFLQYCEAAGFEAAFAINIEETAQDAADLAEYLKGDTTTVWGRKRVQYGHPAPYKVKYIEIGNEEVLFDGDVAEQYDHYIERFNAIYNAMHAKDTSLQFINSVWWRPNSPNSEKLFKALSGKAAYWDFHVDGDSPRAGAKVDRDLTKMRALFKQWAPQSTMKCAIFEENGGLHNLQRALGHATILNAVRRHGDFVLTSCAANALQPLHQNDNGWDQGQIFFTPSEVWGMPPFYAQQMAARNHLPLRCYSRANNGLDVTATRSQNGKVLVLHIINPADTACAANIGIQHFSFTQPVAVSTLAGNLADENTVTQPEKVHTKHTQLPVPRNGIRYTFPAHSYTILRFE